jgi:peptidoglycan/xylan/chitin deacetylase (PgdA/CDA1 family)
LFVALTVDVDPDANRPLPGRVEAVSAGREDGVELDACFRGLSRLLDLLEERSLPATLFWEGRTLEELREREAGLLERVRGHPSLEHGCHGYRHEDFAGKTSGTPLGQAETRAALAQAGEVFAETFNAAPRAFRAPYCRLTPELAQALAQLGYAYDASATRRPSPEWRLRPFRLEAAPAVWELALCRSADRHRRVMSSYLWQLFEGNRPVADYVHLVASLHASCTGGLLQNLDLMPPERDA